MCWEDGLKKRPSIQQQCYNFSTSLAETLWGLFVFPPRVCEGLVLTPSFST